MLQWSSQHKNLNLVVSGSFFRQLFHSLGLGICFRICLRGWVCNFEWWDVQRNSSAANAFSFHRSFKVRHLLETRSWACTQFEIPFDFDLCLAVCHLWWWTITVQRTNESWKPPQFTNDNCSLFDFLFLFYISICVRIIIYCYCYLICFNLCVQYIEYNCL